LSIIEEVAAYNPELKITTGKKGERLYYESNQKLKQVVDSLQSGFFSPEDPSRFKPLIDSLFAEDQYMLFADF
jgi:glucan phosphorylase